MDENIKPNNYYLSAFHRQRSRTPEKGLSPSRPKKIHNIFSCFPSDPTAEGYETNNFSQNQNEQTLPNTRRNSQLSNNMNYQRDTSKSNTSCLSVSYDPNLDQYLKMNTMDLSISKSEKLKQNLDQTSNLLEDELRKFDEGLRTAKVLGRGPQYTSDFLSHTSQKITSLTSSSADLQSLSLKKLSEISD
jgi:hypothetical protein